MSKAQAGELSIRLTRDLKSLIDRIVELEGPESSRRSILRYLLALVLRLAQSESKYQLRSAEFDSSHSADIVKVRLTACEVLCLRNLAFEYNRIVSSIARDFLTIGARYYLKFQSTGPRLLKEEFYRRMKEDFLVTTGRVQ